MSPRWVCETCGRIKAIRGITIRDRDKAKRDLARSCKADGHDAEITYRAGIA